MADSRNEDLLENILGASNEYGEPQSRNEAILQNILGEQNELLPPFSRIETLLLQLKDAMPSGEIEITENGEYDVKSYETATVNVEGGCMDWGDTITDDWETIIENAAAGTVSGYSAGKTKTLEFKYDGVPYAIQFWVADKSYAYDLLAGTNTPATLTLMFKVRVFNDRINTSASNTGGWLGDNNIAYEDTLNETDGELDYGCNARKILWSIYKAFPENLRNAIKTIDKKYDDGSGGSAGTIQTSKEKIWLPCLEEIGLTHNECQDYYTNAVAYACFASADDRKLKGTGNPNCWVRNRRITNATGFGALNTATGTAAVAAANSYYALIGCICL